MRLVLARVDRNHLTELVFATEPQGTASRLGIEWFSMSDQTKLCGS